VLGAPPGFRQCRFRAARVDELGATDTPDTDPISAGVALDEGATPGDRRMRPIRTGTIAARQSRREVVDRQGGDVAVTSR
jgi:hypothetical protein